jgi:ribosome-associated protein
MDERLQISRAVAIPLSEIELRASRSSGPGGQHANVTDSRIEASFDVAASETLTDEQKALLIERLGPRVTAVAQDGRGQARNRELALERLRGRLAEALVVQAPRRPTRPSRAERERRLDGKRRQGERKRARRPPDPAD